VEERGVVVDVPEGENNLMKQDMIYHIEIQGD